MPAAHQTRDLGFDFLDDPTLVVTLNGKICNCNTSAKAFFGLKSVPYLLGDLISDPPEIWVRYLRLASGSTAPRPGKLTFRRAVGSEHARTHAARLRRGGAEPEVILRLLPESSDRFAVLDRRVRDLDRQLQRRHHENAALQEVVHKNRALLRELQHRVKNNIQLMISLLNRAGQRNRSPDVEAVVNVSRGRLQAMAAAQEALYQADEAEFVPARPFFEDVVRRIARNLGSVDAINMAVVDAKLNSEEAYCLALIANELISNAARHGLRDGTGCISVTFSEHADHYRFEVADDGAGMRDSAAARFSGLELVGGLCRQIGAELKIDGESGTRCSIVFQRERLGRGVQS